MLTWIVESHGEKKGYIGTKCYRPLFLSVHFLFFALAFFPVGRWIRVNMETLTKDGSTAATGSFKALVS